MDEDAFSCLPATEKVHTYNLMIPLAPPHPSQTGSQRNNPNDVINIMGALFLCLVFMGYSNAAGVLPIVANARVVFYRERAANMYTVEAFALASVSEGKDCRKAGMRREEETGVMRCTLALVLAGGWCLIASAAQYCGDEAAGGWG